MPDKPLYGDPCNGCGLCCMAQLCPVATIALKLRPSELPCPALIGGPDDTWRCGVMVEPRKWLPVRVAIYGAGVVADAAAFINGAGRGCDGVLEGEVERDGMRASMRAEIDAEPWELKDQVMRVLGIRR